MGLFMAVMLTRILPADKSKDEFLLPPQSFTWHNLSSLLALWQKQRSCAGSGGQPEAALPQLSLQAVRSFWHQPYFTSTIIYCRQYPADGDCLFLLFFLAFLQAGSAGSDRQTACRSGERQICLHLIDPRRATSKKKLKISVWNLHREFNVV